MNILANTINKKISYIVYSLLGIFVILITRLFYLQINLHGYFSSRGEKNFLRIKTISSPRGNILDTTGTMLATNRPIINLFWQGTGNRILTSDQLTLISNLEKILGRATLQHDSFVESIQKYEKKYTQSCIAKDLSFEQLSQIEEQLSHHKNLVLTTDFKRHYPHGPCASHILGYLGRSIDQHSYGQMGLEKIFEETLQGQTGTITQQTDSIGRNVAHIQIERARAGTDIRTTLNLSLQKVCENVFPEKYAGTIILMNPMDGSILSLVSHPTFDPNIFLKPITPNQWEELQDGHPFINRACSASYPIGSIFKLITISAALECGLITPDTIIDCKGFVPFGKRKYWCNRRYGHGTLTIGQALAQSCNVLFFDIGKQIDINTLAQYAYKFGLDSKTNIIFPERTGLIPTREWKLETKGQPWWPGETLSVTIGQSFILGTPIQIARMIGSIFTGYLVKPRVLEQEPIEKQLLTITPQTLNFLRRSMRAVVKHGTGKRLNTMEDIEMYAKTSTAQTASISKRHLGDKYLEHGWFVGHFTYKQEQPLVIVILIENAGTAQVATWVAKQFLIHYKRYIDKKIKK